MLFAHNGWFSKGKYKEQARAELGQAQPILGLKLNLNEANMMFDLVEV